jgi:hypothetical protein
MALTQQQLRMMAELLAKKQPTNALKQQPSANWLNKPLPMEGRFGLLPLRDTPEGKRELALPGLLAGAVNAFTAPGRAVHGGLLEPEKEGLNFAGNMMGGGLLGSRVAPAPAGSAGMAAYRAYKGSGWADDMTPETFARRAESVKQHPDKVFPGAGFFTSNPAVANTFAQIGRNPKVYPVRLEMKNPKVIDAKGRPARDFQWGEHKDEFLGALRDDKYDGVILRNTSDEGDVFVPKRQEQINSAITGRRLVE